MVYCCFEGSSNTFPCKEVTQCLQTISIGRPMDHKRAGVMLYHFEYVYIINGN